MIIEFEVDYDYCGEIEALIDDMNLQVTERVLDPGGDGFNYYTVDACSTDIGYLLSELESSSAPDHIEVRIR